MKFISRQLLQVKFIALFFYVEMRC